MANELLNLKEGGGAVADTHGDYIIPTDGFLADTKYVWQETTPSALPAYNAAWLPSQAVKATYAAPLLPAQSVLIPTSLVTSLSASETGVKLFDLSGSATFSNGVYLGRGGAYVQASILPTRSNNYRWRTRSTSATNNNWRSVCWSPERNRFVAVADTGTGDRVMTSEDGITWTSRTSATNNNWRSVCWSPERNRFVAVAQSGTGDRVMTSEDGITWTSRTSATNNNWRSVCWSPGLNRFVAVADTGTGDRVMTSEDGITWTSRTSAADDAWISVCWSPELNRFVAVAQSGAGNQVMTCN